MSDRTLATAMFNLLCRANEAFSRAAPLISVGLGPNLSVTGSLATTLWLVAIRREGEDVGFRHFLKVGGLMTPPVLVLTLAARLLLPL